MNGWNIRCIMQTAMVRKKVESEKRELYLKALLLRSDIFHITGEFSKNLRDLKLILRECSEPELRFDGLMGLNMTYGRIGKLEHALSSIREAVKIAKKQGDKVLRGRALTFMAYTYAMRGSYDVALETAGSAIKMLQNSLKLKKNRKRAFAIRESISDNHNNRGLIYQELGSPHKALLEFKRALAMVMKMDFKKAIVSVKNNIGNTYQQQGDDLGAEKSLKESLDIAKLIGYKHAIARILGNLATVYRYRKRMDIAIQYLENSLHLSEELGDRMGIAMQSNNIGRACIEQGKYKQALRMLRRAIVLFERIGSPLGIASVHANMGLLHFGKGTFEKALHHFGESEKLAEKHHLTETLFKSRLMKGRILRETGRLKNSMDILRCVIKDTEHFGVKDIFINAVIAYIETVCAGKTTFSKKLYLSKAEPALLLKRAETIAEELGLKHVRGDIATVKKKWEETLQN